MGYPGGKSGSGVYQTIINLMPPHEVYIEPFLGGGAVMRLKRPARLNIGVDLVASAKLPRWPEGGSSLAAGGEGSSFLEAPPVLARAAENARSGDGSSRFEFRQADGIGFLRSYLFTGDELVYCDPPYLASTRSGGRLYEHEMTDAQHRELLAVVRRLPCAVMISGYWSGLYARALRGWNRTSFQAMTRGGVATEWLWFNFPRPEALHDYRYLGANFRERERIKRKKARWTARLGRMPALERQALLAAIADSAGLGDGGHAITNRQFQRGSTP
jgi:hypothetical protein